MLMSLVNHMNPNHLTGKNQMNESIVSLSTRELFKLLPKALHNSLLRHQMWLHLRCLRIQQNFGFLYEI